MGEVAKVISGYAFKSSEFCEKGIPVIKIKNVRIGHVDLADADHVNEKFLSIPDRYHVRSGDVLISLTGSHISQPNSVVGRVARHSTRLPNCLLNQRAGKVLVKNDNTCDLRFLFYALSETETVRAIAMKAHGAANQANVSPTQVESIEIPLPPLNVQQGIASVLAAYDDLIENNQQRIEILESMCRTLYSEWFIKGNASGAMLEPRVLGDICNLVKLPFSETRDGDRPLLDLSRIPQGSIAPADTGQSSELTTSRILFDSGDTLFGAIRCYLHKVVVAHFPGVTNTSVMVLRPKTRNLRSLLAIVASDAETIRWADKHSTGTKMPVISWGVFQNMPVALPSSALESQFEAAAGPMIEQIGILSTRIKNLRRTRDLLLPRLLSGQIEVEAA